MADVSIDASISTSTARGLRSVVFTSATVGYWFYIDSGGTFVYSKTTNGGASWGAAVTINSATTQIAFDVWFDKWTPGDSGTLIHCWYFDSTNDDVFWRTLDTASDTLGTERVAFAGASAVAGRGAFCSGTKCKSGYLYVTFDIDAGAEKGLVRSTDSGTNWSANLSTGFVNASGDIGLLFPATNTGDNNDVIALLHSASTDSLVLYFWDSSAGAISTSSQLDANVIDNTTDLTGQHLVSASVRHSDGHLIIVLMSERDTSTADMRVIDWAGVTPSTGLTQKTNITTNIDDIYYPQLFINQNTNDIYVAYNGKRDGSETLGTTTKTYYTKSTDGGSTWSAGDTAYQEGAASANLQVWAPISGPLFYVGWRVGTTLVGNAVNSVTAPAGPMGDLSKTLDALTLVSAGTNAVVADASKTLGALTLVSDGHNEAPTLGNLSVTLGALTSISAGTNAVVADLSKTLGALTLVSAGATSNLANLSKTLGALTFVSTGTATAGADASKTLGALSFTSAGMASVAADLSKTLGALTTVSAGTVGNVANLSKTLDSLTLVSAGTTTGAGISADLTVTFGALTLSSVSGAGIAANLSKTLGALTFSSAGSASVVGALSKTLGTLTATSAGTGAIVGDLTKTLGALSLVSAGTVISGRVANLNVTLGAATLTSAGTLSPIVQGNLSKTLGSLTIVSTAGATTGANLSAQLGALTLSSTGKTSVAAALSQTLGSIILSAHTGQTIVATADITLGGLLFSSQAGAAIHFADLVLDFDNPIPLTSFLTTGETTSEFQIAGATGSFKAGGDAT